MQQPEKRAMSKVELRPHDPTWRVHAQIESKRLANVLGDNLVVIEHIGSTAIAGIQAKPVIDLLPIVRNLAQLDHQRTNIEELGYAWWGEFHISGRRYCRQVYSIAVQ